MTSPDRRRKAVQLSIQALDVSERRACRVVGQPRSTQRYKKRPADDEEYLTDRIIELASQYGRYGYRRVTALLRNEGWIVNHKRVARIWRRERLKVPQKQPKRGRLWLSDGSVVRLKPLFPQHVWSYDFMQARTHNGGRFRILNVLDEYSRECLASKVARRLKHHDVLDVLTKLFIQKGVPVHIRSDNGTEFTARRVRNWLSNLQINPLFIEPGSSWENGYIESFNGKMRDVEEGVQHGQAAQRFELQTTCSGCNHDSLYPISTGWTNIRSGTNNGGGANPSWVPRDMF